MAYASRIELLAPAGDERALRAALAAGADAVYFGLERWSARAFAGNFAGDKAARAVELAHLWGARAHLALNTLLKDDELGPALTALEAPYEAGLDALIVADLGFAALVRARFPELKLHASTQMNTHSSAQLEALARLGFSRAILARELSLAEIATLDDHGLELEAFVHGALCYGYSGDCLLSSMVGGRSGNRGRCSQSCRMRYSLARAEAVAGGRQAPVPDARRAHDPEAKRSTGPGTPRASERALSTGDLCAIGALPALVAAGVTSFKIEGRMKDAAYVAVTTAVYREALDEALADPDGFTVRPEWSARLEQSFSRGFTTAHLEGRHDEVRSGGRGGHRGVLVGRVVGVDEARGEAFVRLTSPVARGDVVYLYTPWGQTDPTVVEVGAAATERLTLRVRERVALKDRLFRLSVAEAGRLAHELAEGRRAIRPVRLAARLEGREGEPARLMLRELPDGPVAEATSDEPLDAARTAVLGEDRVLGALGALGGTPYELTEVEVALEGSPFLAVGALKGLRRRAVAALDARRLAARRRPATGRRDTITDRVTATELLDSAASHVGPARGRTSDATAVWPAPSACLMRRADGRDVVTLLRLGEAPVLSRDTGAVCLDLVVDDPVDAVARALAELGQTGMPVRCRLPEVLFDADRAWLEAVLALPWAAVHVRHLAPVASPPAPPLVAEYPLQGLNGSTAAALASLAGCVPAAVVASPEASLDEIAALAGTLSGLDPSPAVEALAFGRVQVLHARDRLGRAEGLVEAPGPGEHVALLLEDAKGYVVPAEVGHSGTRLFNARVTNLAANLDELRAAGVSAFHVVQRDLSPDEGRAFVSGGLPALATFVARERTTTGHLFRGVA